jgi:hypothetical protein
MGHRILLVANKTLAGDDLTTIVRERVAAGAAELWILAPASPPPDPSALGTNMAGVMSRPPQESGAELAERRLRDAMYRFRELGIPVTGEVSDKDALSAVADVLARREFDEVIISTLPAGLSHWLRMDLPSRVHREFKLPVTTITARGGPVPHH